MDSVNAVDGVCATRNRVLMLGQFEDSDFGFRLGYLQTFESINAARQIGSRVEKDIWRMGWVLSDDTIWRLSLVRKHC